MPGNTASALFGRTPNTQRDYYIVRGLYRNVGLDDADPNDGFTYLAAELSGNIHESKSTQIIVGVVIMMLMIIIPTVARVVLRASNPGMQFGSDDWAIVVAACVGTVFAIAHILVVVQGGGGQHLWDITYEQYDLFVYWGSLAATMNYGAVSFVEISITLFIRRIAHQASLPWRIFCDVFLGSLVLYLVYAVLSTSIYCSPTKATWSVYIRGQIEEPATCIDTYRNAKALGVIHLIQGTVLLSSPIIMLWKVRMDPGKKIRLFSFWVVGFLAVLGALLDLLLQDLSADTTWSYTFIITWAAIDICFGMLTASLPVLDPFIADAWRSTKKTLSSGRKSSGGRGAAGESKPIHSDARSWVATNMTTGTGNVVVSCGHHSESQEHFVQEDETVEMGIMRTQDFEVRYSTLSTPESMDRKPSPSLS